MADLELGKVVPGFSVDHGRLYYKGRLVLTATSSLLPNFLRDYHGSPVGGHSGESRTYQRLLHDVYRPGMKRMVAEFVRECEVCQRNKTLAMASAGLLQP